MSEDIERSCETCALNSRSCRKKVGECHKANNYSEWRPKAPRFPEDSMAYAEASADQFVHDATDKPNDTINHPSHYTSHPSGIEAIQVTEHMNFCLGNAVKYLWRADEKHDDGGIEDLKKAAWYINRELERRTKEKKQ